MKKENKVSREVALNELVEFVKSHKGKFFKRGILDRAKVEEDFIDALEAMEEGRLTIEEGKVSLSLLEPISIKDGEETKTLDKVILRKRVKRSDVERVTRGVDLQKEQLKAAIKIICLITGLTEKEVDDLNNDDYEAINQIGSVF